jgi:hypothetical protein
MRQWAFDVEAQADLRKEVGRELCVPDWLLVRVHSRRNWYLHPSAIYPSLEAYIDATRAALAADVHVYQAEVAAARPRPPTASSAARLSKPSAPPRPQCRSAHSRRARPSGRAACDVFN